ncbi:AAA family ATPase [Deferrisoma camini]|uniref:AAA family ATPase n=1 Tax=Deferrisoma camini TaxID=1035120 RepID=UPI00046CF471|nr:AAA family ATPase [Deferrisoma camini]
MHRKLERVFYEVREPRLTWDDIGGFPEVKQTLDEMICLPLRHPDRLERLGLTPPAGVMLWGPLGVGITMLAEAAARAAGAGFVYVSGQEMLGKPDEIHRAFDDAAHEAPCVLFVSDCEWLAPRAGCSYEWGPGNLRGIPPTFADPDLTRRFIEEVDRIQGVPGVALVGSCYRIDTVDQALIKEKRRFNRKVFVPPPRQADRRAMLDIYLARIPRLSPEVDADDLARRTEGYVGWDIESLCKRAALEAAKAGRDEVVPEDFERALERITPWLTPDMVETYWDLFRKDCPHHYAF